MGGEKVILMKPQTYTELQWGEYPRGGRLL